MSKQRNITHISIISIIFRNYLTFYLIFIDINKVIKWLIFGLSFSILYSWFEEVANWFKFWMEACLILRCWTEITAGKKYYFEPRGLLQGQRDSVRTPWSHLDFITPSYIFWFLLSYSADKKSCIVYFFFSIKYIQYII